MDDRTVFFAVVEANGFAAAARQLETTPASAISTKAADCCTNLATSNRHCVPPCANPKVSCEL